MCRYLKIMLSAWLCGFVFAPAFAQQDTIRGIVLSSIDSTRLPGAAVLWKNSSSGVRADQQGQFAIIRSNASQIELIISSVGYAKDTIEIKQYQSGQVIRITLVPDARSESVIVEESGLQSITKAEIKTEKMN